MIAALDATANCQKRPGTLSNTCISRQCQVCILSLDRGEEQGNVDSTTLHMSPALKHSHNPLVVGIRARTGRASNLIDTSPTSPSNNDMLITAIALQNGANQKFICDSS
uniref:Uncharacterized protein n=1 Tax=Coccidioides posadasii RMSCC 3488 TaxID=454284 RepID=A0A0J6F623_COCPO|nr:hypothetical protein CPAG_01959 [Coccidioides posadasii RMSCC 3488]